MKAKSKTNAQRKRQNTADPSLREAIPDPLKNTPNWIPWSEEKRNGEVTKVPYNAHTHRQTDATDPSNGTTFQDALSVLSAGDYDGLGFIFTSTKYAGIDLDGCRNPKNGEVSEQAREIVDRFDSYTEISPSGTGLHILVIGSKPGDRCRYKDLDGVKEVELYDTSRYFTMTGDTLENTPGYLSDGQDELNAVYAELFGEAVQSDSDGDTAAAHTDTADLNGGFPTLELDDETVLEKLRSADNSEKFERLFYGGETTLYADDDSQNEADCALVGLLLFYTGNDPEQIDRLFRKSALSREKWTNRPDYRRRTINRALKGRDASDFYSRDRKNSTTQIVRELIQTVPCIDWPNPRTNETDKATYRALLEIAERTCSLTFSASTRQLSELSGVSRPTVINALERLQSYGEGSGFVSKISDPEGTNATRWRVHRTSFNHKDTHASGVRSTGKSSSGVSVEELQDTVYFPSALGRKARSIIQVLRRTGPVDSVTELADRAGTTPRTVRRKLDKLEDLEVTDSEKEGRSRKVWLQDSWKERLDEYRCEAPTWLRDIDRRIKHREEQIIHEYQSDKRKEGDLRVVPVGSGGQKVQLPSEVIRYINLERKCREKAEIRREDGTVCEEADEMLDELAELQGEFSDRVKKLAADLLDLIREVLEREREKWGDR